jgi:hypothetical protein
LAIAGSFENCSLDNRIPRSTAVGAHRFHAPIFRRRGQTAGSVMINRRLISISV